MSVPTAIIIILGEAHLRRILKSYARYYNETRTHLAWIRMRPFLAQFSEPVWSGHLPSWADFITTTSGFRFSAHTAVISAVRMLTGIPKEFQFGAEAERRIIRSYSSHPHHQICPSTPHAPPTVLNWSWDVRLDRIAGRLRAKAARPTFGRAGHRP